MTTLKQHPTSQPSLGMNCQPTSLSFLVLTLACLGTLLPIQGRELGWAAAMDSQKRLSKSAYYPGQVISRASWYRSLTARSLPECLAECGPMQECVSVLFKRESSTCVLCNDTSRIDCSNMDRLDSTQGNYYEIPVVCVNEGEVPGPGGKCVCGEGYRGKPCQPYIGDCAEGFQRANFTDKTIQMIFPLAAPQPFPVYCRLLTDLPRTYIMERRKGDVNFNRNFSDYEKGFGLLDGDHFLGLQQLYYLTASKQYEFRASITLKNGSNYFQQYITFTVSGADDGYRLTASVNPYVINLLGDCLTPLRGAKFSTFDRDNDGDDSVNCAQKHGGGFWFLGCNCSTCNPTGQLMTPTASGLRLGVDNETFWTNNLVNVMPVKVNLFLVVLPPYDLNSTTIATP